MRLRIGKVLPALAMSLVVAEAGAALVSSAAASAPSPVGSAPDLAVAFHYPSSKPGQIAALQLQYGLPAGSAVRSRWPAAQIQPEPPLGAAKTSALMLSSLGMIGVISLLRLGRAP